MRTKSLMNLTALLILTVIIFQGCSNEEPYRNDSSIENLNMDNTIDFIESTSKLKFNNSNFSNTEFSNYDKLNSDLINLTTEQTKIYQKERNNIKEFSRTNSGEFLFEIYPTGIYPHDRINVQTLIRELGESGIDAQIILKSRNKDGVITSFNFGFSDGSYSDGGWVVISDYNNWSGSLQIKGERFENEITTISGGFRFPNAQGGSFYIVRRNNDSFSIKNIKFTNQGGIETAELGNLEIKDCFFQNTTVGIDSFGDGGDVSVNNNEFDMCVVPIRIWRDNPNTIITDNTMHNVSGIGLVLGKITGNCIVKNNLINTIQNDFPFNYGGNGIYMNRLNASLLEIADNIISCDNELASGIVMEDFNTDIENVIISNNDITMYSKYWSAIDIIGVFGNTIKDICISNNKISGQSGAAFFVSSYPIFGLGPLTDIKNVVISNNDLTDFASTGLVYDGFGLPVGYVDVFFDETTHDSSFCGEANVIIDRGVNNSISENGCKSCNSY